MRAPAFWWREAPSAAATLLRPAGALYGVVAARRLRRPGETPPVPVVCVGNFSAGGAGKTPTALALADVLGRLGHRPAFLSRGYGGRLAGPVLVDPARHGADAVGDEPLLLARAAPTVVARDRPAGARLCVAAGATVVVMDDGLQNPSLAKTLAVAVVDGATGVGNGLCLPAGPLRAPLHRQWPLVQGVVLVGSGEAGERVAGDAARRGLPLLRARLRPEPGVAAALRGRPVVAFAGIGRPGKLFDTLEAIGARVAARHAFPDHHAYRADELLGLLAEAEARGAVLVTTEKDFWRIPDPLVRQRLTAVPVRLAFDDAAGVLAWLAAGLSPA